MWPAQWLRPQRRSYSAEARLRLNIRRRWGWSTIWGLRATDPVCGLVQIPCIERNAYAAARALDANLYAAFSDGKHRVDFDRIVAVMKQTGHDLPSLYKETALGGLAATQK